MNNCEIERKFLVTSDSYRAQATRHYSIQQGYLCKDIERVVRIRIRDERASLTIKAAPKEGSITRFEWEKEIDLADAKELMQKCLPGAIEKTRYIIPVEGSSLKWEVDEFHGRLEGLVVAEIELENESQAYEKPDFVGEEVTENPRYYNANL